MKSTETTSEISKALVALQEEIENPAKTKEAGGGQKRFKYAELPDILDDVRPLLKKNDLAVVMEAITLDGKTGVTARILHVSGQWIECGPLLLPSGNDAQSAGSAITYARRYLLCAALGIAADDDDDGAQAKRPEPAVYGEGTAGSGASAGAGEGTDVTDSSAPAHEHVWIASPKLSKWEICSVPRCVETRRRPAETVLTAPVGEDEARKDLG